MSTKRKQTASQETSPSQGATGKRAKVSVQTSKQMQDVSFGSPSQVKKKPLPSLTDKEATGKQAVKANPDGEKEEKVQEEGEDKEEVTVCPSCDNELVDDWYTCNQCNRNTCA